jgi:hypothetical protein
MWCSMMLIGVMWRPQALGHLLDSASSAQLVLVVTAREREMGRGHPVSRVFTDLRRTRDLSELRLEGLDAGGRQGPSGPVSCSI